MTTESLPQWNLADLYAAPDADSLKGDLKALEAQARSFNSAYKGKIASMDGKALGQAIAEYEDFSEIAGKVMSYAQLLFSTDMSNSEIGRFYQTVQEKITDISTHTLFFELEINRLTTDELNERLKAPEAAKYAPWLRDIGVFKPHQLSDELEQILMEKQVTGKAAWVRLFEETMASLRFPMEDEELTASEIFNKLSSKDREVRKAAGLSIGKVLEDNIRIFSLITNTLAKDKEIEDRWRGYEKPVSARNKSNLVEDEVVEALTSSVKDSYGDLAHRYYRLKAGWMGLDKLEFWDRNAPLPDDDDTRIPWEEAKRRVLTAYGAFAPEMADIAQGFFDKRWIDAEPRPGKDSGAFSHPTVPSAHPYILMNYHGKTRDVMTLAHELGHGVHQVLAAGQGTLQSDTPLTLAETASVFGEMLTFRALIDGETDAKRRRVMLAGKVEDMLNTVVRQVAFFEFERLVHDQRREGELSAQDLGDIWMQVQDESLGDAFHFTDDYRTYWSYIPHFIHTPFYVYAYAFGDCLVNSLYDVFAKGHEGFQTKYLNMLRAGGTLRHRELLAPFGLDATDPSFWKRGLKVVSGFIDELEETL